MKKKNLLVLFGGQSSEHDVSCMSCVNILASIDRDKYKVYAVGITREGRWIYIRDEKQVGSGAWENERTSAVLSPDASEKALYIMDGGKTEKVRLDVAFPVLHGLYGEDGTVQGIFDLMQLPYVGCGVLSSAATMDKVITKLLVQELDVPQAAYVVITRNDLADMDDCIKRVEKKFSYPVFVKPSCAGSSVGVTKALNREMLENGLKIAAENDYKVLVEELITGREVECAVLGDKKHARASGVGEIIAAADFYDFDAKYNNAESITDVRPDIPMGIRDEIRQYAVRIFKGLGCHSLSRVDFFLTRDRGAVFNEINTIPGFTDISMYPMLFREAGMDYKELISTLLDTAFTREDH